MMRFHLRSRHLSEISGVLISSEMCASFWNQISNQNNHGTHILKVDVSQSSLKGPACRAGYRERSRCSSSARDAPGGDRPLRSGPVRVRVGVRVRVRGRVGV